MPVKTKVNLKGLKGFISNGTKKANKEVKDDLATVIREYIASGISPVKGKNRFKAYSDKYAKQKGVSKSDVDMILSGEMLSSLKIRKIRNKPSWEIGFFGEDASKKAEYHDRKGAGRSRIIRRLLPTRKGETFKNKIINLFVSIINKALRKEARK